MEERRIYLLASGTGYVVPVNGNFATLVLSGPKVHASVTAFGGDANTRFQTFDDPAEAAAWALSTAETHVGSPNQFSSIEYWEGRHCYSITVTREESGLFWTGVFPMWADSDRYPDIWDRRTFPTLDEALAFAREWADSELEHLQTLQEDLRKLRSLVGSGEPWTGFIV